MNFDLLVLGSGPGGYVAAIRASQLGMKVACVEKEERLGGVCLNRGCIPSKALLDSSEYYHLAKERFAAHGIKTGRVSLDLPAMMARKDQVVQELTENVRRLLEGHKIEIIHGIARLLAELTGLPVEDLPRFVFQLRLSNVLNPYYGVSDHFLRTNITVL